MEYKNVHVLNHPLAQEILTKVRDKRTNQVEFRKGISRLGRLIGYELIKTMKFKEITVETPIAPAKGIEITEKKDVLIVTVLRASIPLTDGLLKAFPEARQGIISAKRIELEDAKAVNYQFDIKIDYMNVPEIRNDTVLIISDPMLASGSTMVKVIDTLLKKGKPKRLILASVISCPTGLERVLKAFPQAEIITVAIDPELNNKGYIVPGLGDAGDRSFH